MKILTTFLISLGFAASGLLGACGAKESEGGNELGVVSKAKTYTNNLSSSSAWAQYYFGINPSVFTDLEHSKLYNGQLTEAGFNSNVLLKSGASPVSVGTYVNVHIIKLTSPWFDGSKNIDTRSYRMCVNEFALENVSHWYGPNPSGTGFSYSRTKQKSCNYYLNGELKHGSI